MTEILKQGRFAQPFIICDMYVYSSFPVSQVLGSIPGLVTYFRCSPTDSRGAVASYWRKYVHEVLVNRLWGLSLPRKNVVRLTDRPDMTLDVYRGRKTTIQHNTTLCHRLSGVCGGGG